MAFAGFSFPGLTGLDRLLSLLSRDGQQAPTFRAQALPKISHCIDWAAPDGSFSDTLAQACLRQSSLEVRQTIVLSFHRCKAPWFDRVHNQLQLSKDHHQMIGAERTQVR